MGSRSKTRTVVDLLGAFFQDRTWTQAALSKELDVDTKTIRRVLSEMQAAGLPFEREEDHPHVYWSLPASWMPHAIHVEPQAARRLLLGLLRLPESSVREGLVRQLLSATSAGYRELFAEEAIVHDAIDLGLRPDLLEIVQDATLSRQPLAISYYSASRGSLSDRTVSPVRIADRNRSLLAFCHRREAPLWFRLDRIQQVRVDDEATYRGIPRDQVDELVAESHGGFSAPGDPISVRFRVLPPATRWFDIPSGLQSEERGDVILVHGMTRGLSQLAVRLLGLGEHVIYDSDELRAEVRRLAQIAIERTRD